MKLQTTHVYPPIPDRSCDWSAVDADTYDGAPDSHCPIGRGPTEKAAIEDLFDQMMNKAYDDGWDDARRNAYPCDNKLDARRERSSIAADHAADVASDEKATRHFRSNT